MSDYQPFEVLLVEDTVEDAELTPGPAHREASGVRLASLHEIGDLTRQGDGVLLHGELREDRFERWCGH